MFNKTILIGRPTTDIELKTTTSGTAVTSFTLAVTRSYAKQGEERQTDFIDIVAWRGTAEFASKYVLKGQMIAVDGSLQTRTYEDKEGKKRKVTEVVAEHIYFAEGKKREDKPAFTSPDTSDFEQIVSDDDELPF